MKKNIVLLLMTSRSGSSMIADIFVHHGFHWAKDPNRNPLVGGKKVRYRSFENQVVKDFNRREFGTPLGDMITFDDRHVRSFRELVRIEYPNEDMNVWKGAVEFFPLWLALHDQDYDFNIKPCIIWRPMDAVMDSLRAKRQGRVNEDDLISITQKRYDILSRLAADYAFPVIETDNVVKGDFSSLAEAMAEWGYDFYPSLAEQTIKPDKWETDR